MPRIPSVTLPGSRYIGPGNSLDSGRPTNKFDSIAQIHDIEYDQAHSESDIREADVEFLINTYNSEAETPTEQFHKYVGLVGISVKYAVESLTGVIYPTQV